MRRNTRFVPLLTLIIAVSVNGEAAAQKTTKGWSGKTACALLSSAEIRQAAGRNDVANRTSHMDEDTQSSSNCQHWGAVDITIHLGTETKVMFARQRDTYAKAPARLGYKIERLSGIGDDAYYMSSRGTAEVRAMVGETDLAVSLSGSLPPELDAKKMAVSLAKAAVAKLR
ncbi:MAG TPA: hypothetical protein VLN49_07840 [Gemmatimonadaceae bacterium]|nr:hypothetical protein [Gemmatimonadaceae bacterium]